jgi:hypothetical protein
VQAAGQADALAVAGGSRRDRPNSLSGIVGRLMASQLMANMSPSRFHVETVAVRVA